MRIDTHLHFWSLANPFTDWPTPDLASIHRDFGPEDIATHLADGRIDGTILVQAAPSLAETEYCLKLAAQVPSVRGVVGWVDFESSDVLAQLERLAQNPLLKGLRPMVQSIEEPAWILRDSFNPIFRAMERHGLRFDALVLSHQLHDIDQLSRRYPALLIVLDHGGKPPIANGTDHEWRQDIARLAHNPSVYCKLSGLWTEAGEDRSVTAIQPFVDYLLASFGPERLMWGSDWPVINLAGTYNEWLEQCEAMLAALSNEQKAAVFGGNGRRFYGID